MGLISRMVECEENLKSLGNDNLIKQHRTLLLKSLLDEVERMELGGAADLLYALCLFITEIDQKNSLASNSCQVSFLLEFVSLRNFSLLRACVRYIQFPSTSQLSLSLFRSLLNILSEAAYCGHTLHTRVGTGPKLSLALRGDELRAFLLDILVAHRYEFCSLLRASKPSLVLTGMCLLHVFVGLRVYEVVVLMLPVAISMFFTWERYSILHSAFTDVVREIVTIKEDAQKPLQMRDDECTLGRECSSPTITPTSDAGIISAGGSAAGPTDAVNMASAPRPLVHVTKQDMQKLAQMLVNLGLPTRILQAYRDRRENGACGREYYGHLRLIANLLETCSFAFDALKANTEWCKFCSGELAEENAANEGFCVDDALLVQHMKQAQQGLFTGLRGVDR